MSNKDADGICRKCGRGLFTPCTCDAQKESFKRLVKAAIREVREEEASEKHQRAELCVSVLEGIPTEALSSGVVGEMLLAIKQYDSGGAINASLFRSILSKLVAN